MGNTEEDRKRRERAMVRALVAASNATDMRPSDDKPPATEIRRAMRRLGFRKEESDRIINKWEEKGK